MAFCPILCLSRDEKSLSRLRVYLHFKFFLDLRRKIGGAVKFDLPRLSLWDQKRFYVAVMCALAARQRGCRLNFGKNSLKTEPEG